MPFNLADYEPVEERLARFWTDHPNGRVHTELVNGSHGGESVVIIASVYKDKADLYPDATGHAQETPGSNPVNKTSWIENCETSAIGRALANMGYAPKGHRPSREEMAKAAAPRPTSPPRRAGRGTSTKAWKDKSQAQRDLLDACKEAKIDANLRHRICMMLTGHESSDEMSDEECEKVTGQVAWFQMNRSAGMEALADWEARNLP